MPYQPGDELTVHGGDMTLEAYYMAFTNQVYLEIKWKADHRNLENIILDYPEAIELLNYLQATLQKHPDLAG